MCEKDDNLIVKFDICGIVFKCIKFFKTFKIYNWRFSSSFRVDWQVIITTKNYFTIALDLQINYFEYFEYLKGSF